MVVDDRRAAEGALLFRRLLLEDVAREGVPAADLAFGGHFEALLRAGVCLHLGHREPMIMARTPCGAGNGVAERAGDRCAAVLRRPGRPRRLAAERPAPRAAPRRASRPGPPRRACS